MNEVYEMDLWQFFCYIDGIQHAKIERLKEYMYLAIHTGIRTGQYFSGKKAPDARIEFDRLDSIIDDIYYTSIKEKRPAEQELDDLKKQLKLFD